MGKKNLDSDDMVLFEGPGSLQLKPGELKTHGLEVIADRLFGRKLVDIEAEWTKVMRQIRKMLEAAYEKAPKGFNLDSVDIALGFNAKGKLVFIAEGGVEATVTVKFKHV
jgi:hypothetical protein